MEYVPVAVPLNAHASIVQVYIYQTPSIIMDIKLFLIVYQLDTLIVKYYIDKTLNCRPVK